MGSNTVAVAFPWCSLYREHAHSASSSWAVRPGSWWPSECYSPAHPQSFEHDLWQQQDREPLGERGGKGGGAKSVILGHSGASNNGHPITSKLEQSDIVHFACIVGYFHHLVFNFWPPWSRFERILQIFKRGWDIISIRRYPSLKLTEQFLFVCGWGQVSIICTSPKIPRILNICILI